MIIKSSFKNYEVDFKTDFSYIDSLIKMENAFFVIDKNLLTLYPNLFSNIQKSRLFVLEATENNKIIDTALEICEKMTEIPAKRNATIVSFGGGIIQDITGFVANVLYRGINWHFIPTTLLAACDSCIGGKTSLNYKSYKNLLGTFYPPDHIYICPLFFKTLSDRDFKSGLGEVVKFNIMVGEEGLDSMEKNIEFLLDRDAETVEKFVKNSLLFKKTFIEQDEFDRGERIKLNFAHTFGHAIETTTNYLIPHGTAVAAGMIMADFISFKRGLLSENMFQRAERILLKVIDINIDLLNYPTDIFISAMKKDKKQTNTSITAVLMTQTNKGLIVVNDLTINDISDAVAHFVTVYKKQGMVT